MQRNPQRPLTGEEQAAIVLAVQAAFSKLRHLYHKIQPIFESLGFAAPSPGVIAQNLSETIAASIGQHCPSFTKGQFHGDLQRGGFDWEVKVCKDSGLTINQSKVIKGESYIVANYKANAQVVQVWVLWNADDHFFSSRRANSNARALISSVPSTHVQVLQSAAAPRKRVGVKPTMAKADLKKRRARAV